MALYCINYLSSQPFSLLATQEMLEQSSKRGYYVLLDYAASYWVDHLQEGIDRTQRSHTPASLHDRIAFPVKLFLHENHVLDQHNLDMLDRGHSEFFATICGISKGIGARNQWLQLEVRCSRITKTLEAVMENLHDQPAGIVRESMMEMYGTQQYRCHKLGCIHFQKGFMSKSRRETHQNRHERPFPCPKAHCPSQALGFPDEKGLKRHLFQTHRSEGDKKEPSFPEKKTKEEDDVFSAVSAAIEGDSNAVLQLIGLSDSVNKIATDGHTTPLGLAIQHSHLAICTMLVKMGAEVSEDEMTLALMSDDPEIIQYFLASDAGLGSSSSWNAYLLDMAIRNDAEKAVELILHRDDPRPDGADAAGLMLAAEKNNQRIVSLLLATGKVDPNLIDASGNTPLLLASQIGSSGVATLLLSTGKVDPNAIDRTGRTPLWYATNHRMVAVVKLLLEHPDILPDLIRNDESTPLTEAIKRESVEIVTMLLATGRVDVNRKNKALKTPIMLAVSSGSEAIAKKLLDTGKVELEVQELFNESVLSYSKMMNSPSMVNLFLSAGAVDEGSLGYNSHNKDHLSKKLPYPFVSHAPLPDDRAQLMLVFLKNRKRLLDARQE